MIGTQSYGHTKKSYYTIKNKEDYLNIDNPPINKLREK